MLLDFFYHLRERGLPVSIQEHLTLLDALCKGIMPPTLDDFYHLSRLVLIKDETLYDRFDLAFGEFYQPQLEALAKDKTLPEDWLRKTLTRNLTPEQKAALEKHGLEKLLEMFKERLKEQQGRHAGGNKWIGTGGSSPFGHGGYHPEGIRIGGPSAGNRTAIKVWEKREFVDYDDQQELGTRNFKMALRRLRRFARQGAPTELDLDSTIRETARNAGMLDLQMQAERQNRVNVLMLLDIGGSMDDHIAQVESLFSAARSEFKHLEAYYFHNCVYESVWQNNSRRQSERLETWDLLRKYNEDWRIIIVGDATMSPYEIMAPGGSVEHYNKETGAAWLQRLNDHWPRIAWLNPEPQAYWPYRQSIAIIQNLMSDHMYPVTSAGLEEAMRYLSR
ncbi:VWA domain-containing protein [Alcaligenes faecalis]|uniref:VWA domain-containing protein n=1 Tax=Alcaligenes faecalis TaxID=511 RepID=UPI0034D6FA29